MGDCDHGGDPLACGRCRAERGETLTRERPGRTRFSRPFRAKYEGTCRREQCRETIFVGETIAFAWESGDEEGKRVVHFPGCAK